MLDEIKRGIRGRGPEVVALNDVALFSDLALLAPVGSAALVPKGRVGERPVETVARSAASDRPPRWSLSPGRHCRNHLAGLEGFLLALIREAKQSP